MRLILPRGEEKGSEEDCSSQRDEQEGDNLVWTHQGEPKGKADDVLISKEL